jgi:hypothetical protein
MFRHGPAVVRNSRVIHRLPVVRHLCTRQEKPPAQPVNINAATSEELQQVLRELVPPPRKKSFRCANHTAHSRAWTILLPIRGLGRKGLEKIRKYERPGKQIPRTLRQQRAVPAAQNPKRRLQ